MIVVLAWALFAFGGGYLRAAMPFVAGVALLAIVTRPPVGTPPQLRGLDIALLALAGGLALQIVPLPGTVIAALSPQAITATSQLRLSPPDSAPIPSTLSIDRPSSLHAAAVAGASILLFWTARGLFRRSAVRVVCRGIAALGLIVAAIAIAQHATAGGLIYWRWSPYDEGAPPFGPFVNRNHFGTWAVMALPLCLGYLAARASHARLSRPSSLRARVARQIDGRTMWLLASAAMLTTALLLSLSRSSLVGLGLGLLVGLRLVHARGDRPRQRWLVIASLILLAIAMLRTDVTPLVRRFSEAKVAALDRMTIWRETLPIIRDFWMTGTGAGTYQDAMLLYQKSDRTVYFNQAHSHYLQVATEGGLLFSLPAALALIALLRLGRDRLRADHSGMFWIRAGAASGLVAVATQSLWETGLTMPANAALAAVLAAVLLHEPHSLPPAAE